MSERIDGQVIGTIEPAAEPGEPPLFRIIREYERQPSEPSECDHPAFTLDEKWATVTCSKCNERLDPFAVLRNYANWWERIENRRQMYVETHKKLIVDELRRLRRSVSATDEHVARVDELISVRWRLKLDELHAGYVEVAAEIKRARSRRKKGQRLGS